MVLYPGLGDIRIPKSPISVAKRSFRDSDVGLQRNSDAGLQGRQPQQEQYIGEHPYHVGRKSVTFAPGSTPPNQIVGDAQASNSVAPNAVVQTQQAHDHGHLAPGGNHYVTSVSSHSGMVPQSNIIPQSHMVHPPTPMRGFETGFLPLQMVQNVGIPVPSSSSSGSAFLTAAPDGIAGERHVQQTGMVVPATVGMVVTPANGPGVTAISSTTIPEYQVPVRPGVYNSSPPPSMVYENEPPPKLSSKSENLTTLVEDTFKSCLSQSFETVWSTCIARHQVFDAGGRKANEEMVRQILIEFHEDVEGEMVNQVRKYMGQVSENLLDGRIMIDDVPNPQLVLRDRMILEEQWLDREITKISLEIYERLEAKKEACRLQNEQRLKNCANKVKSVNQIMDNGDLGKQLEIDLPGF